MTPAPPPAPSRLATIWSELVAAAMAQPNVIQRRRLVGGARLAVEVHDGRLAVTIARTGVMVGTVEERTFRKHCQIPEDARRIPEEGQHTTPDGLSWYVGFVWAVEAGEK